MAPNYQIDKLDLQILQLLQRDARMPYLEMARKLLVSGGTIHQRIDKLKDAGILVGNYVKINHSLLGNGVATLIGIHLVSAKNLNKLIEALEQMDEVVEAYYTTGSFALMINLSPKILITTTNF